jgi:hypothetical protein
MEWNDPQEEAVTAFAKNQAMKVIKAIQDQYPEDRAFIYGTERVAAELLVGLAIMLRRNANDEIAKKFLNELFNWLVEATFDDREEDGCTVPEVRENGSE